MNSFADASQEGVEPVRAASRHSLNGSPPDRLKRSIVGLFERGLGARIAAVAADVRFGLWRLRHGNASYTDFYARTIAARLGRGGAHKTLGTRDYRSGTLTGSVRELGRAEHRNRGRNYFEWFLARNLRRDMTCIDYGCGSLRVGQHFIEFLDADRFWGLDIVDKFFRDGLTLIDAAIVAAKRPELHVIESRSLALAGEIRADVIYSTAVLQHVPPNELDTFFGNIVRLMNNGCIAVINFKKAETAARIAANAWAHAPEALAEAIERIDPTLHVAIEDWMRDKRHQQAMLVFSRNPNVLANWLQPVPAESASADRVDAAPGNLPNSMPADIRRQGSAG